MSRAAAAKLAAVAMLLVACGAPPRAADVRPWERALTVARSRGKAVEVDIRQWASPFTGALDRPSTTPLRRVLELLALDVATGAKVFAGTDHTRDGRGRPYHIVRRSGAVIVWGAGADALHDTPDDEIGVGVDTPVQCTALLGMRTSL